MSQTTNISELEEILTILQDMPEGEGGPKINTCTVQLSCSSDSKVGDVSGTVEYVSYTSYENYILEGRFLNNSTSGIVTLSNVPVNSAIVFKSVGAGTRIINAEYLGSFGSTQNYVWCYKILGDATIHTYACYLPTTLITLSNLSTKQAKDITYDDTLLVWNFDKGCYDYAKPLWIKKAQTSLSYYHCIFEDGTTLDLVGGREHAHRVFCLDTNRFEYANDCVGKNVFTQNGFTKMISCEIVEEETEYYNIITDYHMNLFANSILTSTGFNNLYPIKDMKFVKEKRELIPYENFTNCPREYYDGLRLGEQIDYTMERMNEKIQTMVELALPKGN